MEPQDFDHLARSAAGGVSRRRVAAWLGGGAASLLGMTGLARVQAAATTTAAPVAPAPCTLQLVGHVRLGPDKDQPLVAKAKTPGELRGNLGFAIGKNGAIEKGTLVLADGTKLAAVGQAVGRALNLRITLPSKKVVVLVGTAAEDLGVCHGAADGLLTGPQAGDLGDWHATAVAAASLVAPSPAGGSSSGGNSTGGNASGGGCPAGQTVCGTGASATCVDTSSDPANCGDCGTVCRTGTTCTKGVCTGKGTCPPGQADCGKGCVNLGTEAQCRSCGDVCGQNQVCCDVNTGCVSPQSDPKNCGGCGNACPQGQSCTNGVCGGNGGNETGGCPAGQANCGNGCIDLGTEQACRNCNDVCGQNQVCCDVNTGCVSPQTDPANCGTCGNACPQGQACVAGTCTGGGGNGTGNGTGGCPAGQADCGNGCVFLGTEAQCRSCGDVCGQNQVCCSVAAGCVDTNTDPANCGTCGNACAQGQTCNSGACQ